MNHIVIVTSGQPYANPRTVKEATALSGAGYKVTVLYTPLSPWADKFDKKLFGEMKQVTWIKAGRYLLPNSWYSRYIRLRRKLYEFFYRLNLTKSYEKVYIHFAQELWSIVKDLKADLYIAHNLGALPLAVKAALKFDGVAAFDAEDFYPAQMIGQYWYDKAGMKIEEVFIPKVKYMTAASPLIAERYREMYPGKEVIVINNVFSKKYLQEKISINKDGLHLFWFSQFLGPNRGLETVVEAMNILKDKHIYLHLIGEYSSDFKHKLSGMLLNSSRLEFKPPVLLENLFIMANRYDIGMATEVAYNENRNICLTNKIFSYPLAGIALVASDTLAQKKFMEENSGIGLIYENGNAADLASKLELLYNDKNLLLQYKKNALALAATRLNWEAESKQLLNRVKQALNN